MAKFQALAAACEAVVQLLRNQYRPEQFAGMELEFKVYSTQDFTAPMQTGVSLFLHRVTPNTVFRTPPGRAGVGGKAQKSLLPLDLHLLVTVWGKDASLQNTLTGWVMRTLEDTPILPASLLNTTWEQVYRPDETIEIILSDIGIVELMHIWDRLPTKTYQLSIPYVVRGVQVESNLPVS